MKTQIHPKWFDDMKVTCACGNSFAIGGTMPELHVDICSNCHPFYTGQMKYIDTAGRVDAFKAKQAGAQTKIMSKTQKRQLKKAKKIAKELEKPETLEELRKQMKSSKKKAIN